MVMLSNTLLFSTFREMITVLYVDDEKGLLQLGKAFLEKMGSFSVDIRGSAREALQFLESSSCDVIVSDYQMPGMDGLDLLLQVRSLYGRLPFILFTGRGREEVVIEAINRGVDFYLQKGGDFKAQFAELALKIRQASQRRKAEISLEESERRYRDVVETQSEFISRFSPDGTHVFVNEAYCRHFGKKSGDIIGKKFLPKIPLEDCGPLQDHFASLTPHNPSAEIEHRVIMPDGRIRWHWWSDHAIFDKDGRVVEYQSLGKDITARKDAEQAIRDSENLYRTIFTTTGAGTIIIEEDTKISLANSGFARISGYTIGEIEGKMCWTDFVVPEDLQRMKKYHENRRDDPGTAPEVYEFRFIDRFGTIRPCINNVAVIPGTRRSVASVVDISEQVRVEHEYRNIFNNIQDVFYRTDTRGNLVLASPSAAPILGYPDITELYGKNIADTLYLDPSDRERFMEEINRTGNLANFEVILKKKDGTAIFALGSSHRYYDARGNYQGIEGILRDITGRKRAEEAVAAEKRLSDAIIDSTPGIFYVFRATRRLVRWNRNLETVFGYSHEELVGMDIVDFVIGEERAAVLSHFEDLLLKAGRSMQEHEPCPAMSTEVHLFTRDRRTPLYLMTSIAVVIAGNTYVVGAGIDITEERKAQQRKSERDLRESEEKFRATVEQSADGIVLTDGEFRIIEWNPAQTAIYGYSREEMLGNVLSDSIGSILPGRVHDLIPLYTSLKTMLESRPPSQISSYMQSVHECRIRSRDGSDKTVQISVFPIRLADRILFGSFSRDITDRIEAEEALRKSEEKYRAIVENIQDLVYRTDLMGRLVWVTPAGVSLTGYKTTEELIGKDVATEIYDNPRDREALLALVAREGKVENYPLTLKAGDGTLRYVTTSSHFYYDHDGAPLGIEGVLHDITDRKRALDALRQANYKLNLLTGITRHDIINQLVLMMAYIELIRKRSTSPEIHALCEKAEKKGSCITTIIKFTKQYEEIGISDPVWIHATAIVDTVVGQMAPGSCRIQNDIPLGFEVYTDKLIVRVFDNLVDNSVRHGGHVTRVRFYIEESGEDRIIVCEDDGVGISHPEKEQIFDRGFGKNTGLGLALSKEILAITGIGIIETGDPGEGARFEMTVHKGMWRMVVPHQDESKT